MLLFSQLGKTKLDYIHITEYQAWKPAFSNGESLVCLAKKFSGIPVIANGQLEDPKRASDIIMIKSG
ncbi:hypothetical protein [Paenibacillus sp. MDMC362]|uniref:hypothetical protein n=1 Tax=Paenibacillus sp. MDMC362 TaxID=2977365 RepID=UPI0021A3DEE9|nr:hypothetical protein [Paenibacillus sp. MDMC362]